MKRTLQFVRAEVVTIDIDNMPEGITDEAIEGWANWGYCGNSPFEGDGSKCGAARFVRELKPWKLLHEIGPPAMPIVRKTRSPVRIKKRKGGGRKMK
jgi:hypothetical protein